jgi:hypothetical protein
MTFVESSRARYDFRLVVMGEALGFKHDQTLPKNGQHEERECRQAAYVQASLCH